MPNFTPIDFWTTVTSNGSPYATGPLSCLSATLVYSGQTVGWITMPLGTDVGLSTGDIVLDGIQLPHGKGHSSPPPLFGPCLLWSNGWMNQDRDVPDRDFHYPAGSG